MWDKLKVLSLGSTSTPLNSVPSINDSSSPQSGSEDAIMEYQSVGSPKKVMGQESPYLRGRHGTGASNTDRLEFVDPIGKERNSLRREPTNIEMQGDRACRQPDGTWREKEMIRDELQTEKERSKVSKELQKAKKDIEDMKREISRARGLDDSLRRDLDRAHHQINPYAAGCESQEQEIEAGREKHQHVEAAYHQTRQWLAEKTAELQSAQLCIKKDTEDMKSGISRDRGLEDDLRRDLNRAHHQINAYAARCESQQQELQVVREELRQAKIVHERTRQELVKKTAELQNPHLFLNRGDSLAVTDITRMTADLNAEILQSATVMAGSLDYTERQNEAVDGVLLKVQKYIGETLTKALMEQRLTDGKDVDPTLVQLALQVCLVHCSETIITSWALGGDNDHLSEIYKRIWNEETHSQPTAEQFQQERLARINALSLHLRSSIGQKITCMEIRPFTIGFGSPFDSSEMDDTYAGDRSSNSMAVEVGERVAVSTQLGLIKRVKYSSGKIETRIMLKPKVVLCSALTEDR
ncbi:hypothetical protein C0995_009758 [Termitomyces sp. Mi166|nr:hypothetical protein C0995_009758 [Termitomyces sp. Mi166\